MSKIKNPQLFLPMWASVALAFATLFILLWLSTHDPLHANHEETPIQSGKFYDWTDEAYDANGHRAIAEGLRRNR